MTSLCGIIVAARKLRAAEAKIASVQRTRLSAEPVTVCFTTQVRAAAEPRSSQMSLLEAHLGVRAESRAISSPDRSDSGPDLEDAKLAAGCTEPSPRRGMPPGFWFPPAMPPPHDALALQRRICLESVAKQACCTASVPSLPPLFQIPLQRAFGAGCEDVLDTDQGGGPIRVASHLRAHAAAAADVSC